MYKVIKAFTDKDTGTVYQENFLFPIDDDTPELPRIEELMASGNIQKIDPYLTTAEKLALAATEEPKPTEAKTAKSTKTTKKD